MENKSINCVKTQQRSQQASAGEESAWFNQFAELCASSSDSEEDDLLELVEDQTEEDLINAVQQFYMPKKRNCVKHYLEDVVPTYSEKEFKCHFRIAKSLFFHLSSKFEESDIFSSLRPDKRLSGTDHLAVFLWFAGHEACSYRDLADRFDLSLSSVCRIIERVIMFISNLSPNVIKWPNDEEKQQSAEFFKNKCGFSKAIGCIDGTHITIDPPAKCKDDYIDRKGNVTITMQAICDERKKFINIFVGFPGSSHDSWVLQNSPIYGKLASVCGDYYLLGDSAYPCTQHLITPYKDNGHLTRAQKNFNMKLSSGRVAIEHSFGILKQRFRQLYYCKLRGARKLCHFIRACCVLHNIASETDMDFLEEAVENSEETSEQYGLASRGNALRDLICQELCNQEI